MSVTTARGVRPQGVVPSGFALRTIQELTIDDEPSFRHVGLYAELKTALRRDGYVFRVLPEKARGRWDRAIFLNLTYWGASAGGDVLVDESLPADVVAHAAWHHLAIKALARREGTPMSAAAMFLGESIASAFDVYLVGRLLGHSPDSTFLETQVSAMADACDAAGLTEEAFQRMLERITEAPELAFEQLRQLLFDASQTLCASDGIDQAVSALETFDRHPFAPLLHHYELSNWVLYARAHGGTCAREDALAIDRELRSADDSLAWLATHWLPAR